METITVAASRNSALSLSEMELLVGSAIVVVVLVSMLLARVLRARRHPQPRA